MDSGLTPTLTDTPTQDRGHTLDVLLTNVENVTITLALDTGSDHRTLATTVSVKARYLGKKDRWCIDDPDLFSETVERLLPPPPSMDNPEELEAACRMLGGTTRRSKAVRPQKETRPLQTLSLVERKSIRPRPPR